MQLAPIIIFAFNRLVSLKKCVDSLLQNSEAKDSDLVVFVDGPRADHEGEEEIVLEVRDYVKNLSGFKSISCYFSDINKGLGTSIIEGVSVVINKYGKVIVVEDDLILGRNFLSFMNQGLALYEQTRNVFSVCGYTNKVRIPSDYHYDAYFCPRSSSWGWATWKDRWCSCDWKLEDWDSIQRNAKAFNKWGGSDCFGMLKAWEEGKNRSWAIRFGYNQFAQNKLSLFPILSHVQNNGFDGSGENCKKWSRFKYVFDDSDKKAFIFPTDVVINKTIRKSVLSYHSILIRIYSRLMNMIYR